jgi:hypothetical protein
MRCSKLFLVALFVGTSLLFVSAPAFASTLFSDDFESQLSANTDTAGGPGWGVDCQPQGGSPGSWSVVQTDSYRECFVSSYATPGAAHGSKYLVASRWANTQMSATANFAEQATVGDRIHYEANIWPNTNAGSSVGLYSADAAGNGLFNLSNDGAGGVQYWDGSAAHTISGVSHLTGQYQKWQIDYTIGDTTGILKVGSTSGTFGLQAGYTGKTANLDFNQAADRPNIYIDDVLVSNLGPVPEPSTIALLISAMIGLVAYAWRKRRPQ